jgi:hypothetical protein
MGRGNCMVPILILQDLTTLSLTHHPLSLNPNQRQALSTLAVQPYPTVSRVRTHALLSLSRPFGCRGGLEKKELPKPASYTAPSSKPTTPLCTTQIKRGETYPLRCPIASLWPAPSCPWTHAHSKPTRTRTPLPSCKRARHRTRTLSVPTTWPLIHHTANGRYRTPVCTNLFLLFLAVPARDARSFCFFYS